MKVYIKNKLISLGGSSSVVDENKNPVYEVKGKVFSITRKKYLYDLQGNKLYTIRNKWFNWFVHKAFIYDNDNNKIATVKDKWFNFKNDYFIEGYKDEIKLDGKIFSLSCNIVRNGKIIGKIRREITFIRDSFELEANEEDIPFCIALVIAVDNITDNKRK